MSEKEKIENDKKDPVCGMMVSKDTEYQYFYKDQKYYFCGEPCLISFAQDPEKYVKKSGS